MNNTQRHANASTKPDRNDGKTRFRRQNAEEKPKKLRPVEPYQPPPLDCLPPVLRRFVSEAAASIDCDTSLVLLPILAMLGAAIGNTRRLRMKKDYFTSTVIWSVSVASSGQKKTPAMQVSTRRLHQRQQEAIKRYNEQHNAFLNAKAAYDAALKQWKSEKGSEEDCPRPPEKPIRTRFLMQDLTIEALVPILQENPRGILIERDELSGFFSSMDKYSTGSGKTSSDSANWLSAYNAGAMMNDRKTNREFIYVPSAFICLTGGIQPRILNRILNGENTENGMAARLLCAYPPRRPNTWSENEISEATQNAFDELIDKLIYLDFGLDRNGNPTPEIVHFHPDAKRVYVDFHNRNGREMVDLPESLAAVWSKRAELAPRIALILHCVRHATGETPDPYRLDQETMSAAVELVEWSKREAVRIAALLAENEDEQSLRDLAEWIERRGGRITAAELNRDRRDMHDTEEAESRLEELVSADLGVWENVPPSDRGGRPTRAFVSHSLSNASVDETSVSPEEQAGFVDTECDIPF